MIAEGFEHGKGQFRGADQVHVLVAQAGAAGPTGVQGAVGVVGATSDLHGAVGQAHDRIYETSTVNLADLRR